MPMLTASANTIPSKNQNSGYQSGFGNVFASEALPGALPANQNSPQQVAYGLVAEQLSGTAFTAPRSHNRRSWLYRIRPAMMHQPFVRMDNGLIAAGFDQSDAPPNQLRWDPQPIPTQPTDFIAGLATIGGNGAPAAQKGCAIYWYAANQSMTDSFFYCADGELLIVPQAGRLQLLTEMGVIDIAPQEIAVIPRGIRFQVLLPDGQARGYVCENFGALLRLPDLGPLGANGLANPRDFLTPHAWYENRTGELRLISKFDGNLWQAQIGHSPLDVVAWHGNYAPYKYDLRHFNAIGSISYDHPDPSIFLVLQAQSDTPGVDALDFVIFPPRWLASEHSFRAPWFHRNIASEFMGLIHGQYDAKAQGFYPGGASLHNCMSGHGPDGVTFEKFSRSDTSKPEKITDTMAFMFETRHIIKPTPYALTSSTLQKNYYQCWMEIKKHFDPCHRPEQTCRSN